MPILKPPCDFSTIQYNTTVKPDSDEINPQGNFSTIQYNTTVKLLK